MRIDEEIMEGEGKTEDRVKIWDSRGEVRVRIKDRGYRMGVRSDDEQEVRMRKEEIHLCKLS